LRYSNTHQTGGKRRNDYNSDLVTNIGSAQRDRKYSSQDNRGGNPPRPAAKKFSAADLLDQHFTYHSRKGKPVNHTTAECMSLREIEKARLAKAGHGVDPAQERNFDSSNFGRDAGSLHTFIRVDNRREKKVLARVVAVHAAAVDIPRYLNWSEHDIT
jgi:hypothetical protein